MKSLKYFRHIEGHHTHKLNLDPNWDYLSNPLNCYHIIRHVAIGWKQIFKEIFNDSKIWRDENLGSIIWNNVDNEISMLFFSIFLSF